MSYRFRVTKLGGAILAFFLLLLIGGASYGIWYVNNREKTITSEDANAGDPSVCADGQGDNGQGCCGDPNQGVQYFCREGLNLSCCAGSCVSPDHPSCTNPGPGANCSSCVGSCNGSGCTVTCDENTNPKIDCNYWPKSFYCEGQSNSGCNEISPGYIGSTPGNIVIGENVTFQEGNTGSTWCSTVQSDSNAPNGAFTVVYIGDGGVSCAEGDPNCDPSQLDWDCSVTPPPPVNEPPACTSLVITPATAKLGDTVTLQANVSDSDGAISKVEFYWTEKRADGSYCSANWRSIGLGSASGSIWSKSWVVSGIPTEGDIVISANVTDDDSAWCTGNPSGACGTNATACGACSGTATITIERPPLCGNGVLDSGEQCDPEASTNSCQFGACNANCTCPSPDPDWKIEKSATSVCTSTDPISSRVEYIVKVSNLGGTSGKLGKVVDTLADNVDPAWIDTATISPAGTVSGRTITWTLTGSDQNFAAGQSKLYKYTLIVPQSGFGVIKNVAEGFPLDSGEGNFRVENKMTVGCVPSTGIFDSTASKIAISILLVILGIIYMSTDRFDLWFLKKWGDKFGTPAFRRKFESKL